MPPTVISTPMHPLHEALVDAAHGRFPPVDGRVEVFTPMAGDHHAVVEFTGHSVVLTDRAPSDVLVRGADGFGGASHPDVVRWLAGPSGWIGSHDVVLVARGTGGGSLPESTDFDDHPRVVRSRAHRRDVHVHADASGVVTIGRGLVDRQELSVELLPGAAGQGHGRRLITQGLALVEAGGLVWAQVAPGNAASLRAFLGCGFVSIGAETLIVPATTDSEHDES
jgi:GNAT superfamily N-acetyltransferase